MSDITWRKIDHRGCYVATAPTGDSLSIWKNTEGKGWIFNVRSGAPAGISPTLVDAKIAAGEWAEANLPKHEPVTAGEWSIDDAGNLWNAGEYIGRIYEEDTHGYGRRFYAQGVDVETDDRWTRHYLNIGSSSARNLSAADHAALSAKVAS